MATAERSFIRSYNRYGILNAIRTAGMISRVDIAKDLGLSKASLTGITAELIREGLILEKEPGAVQVGRRPILLAINPDGAYAVGVSMTQQRIQAVIINFQAEIQTAHAVPLETRHYDPEEIVDKIDGAVTACIKTSGFSKARISGIGVSVPGLVDAASGVIRYLPNYGWTDVNLGGMLQDKSGLRTHIDNDANNLTIAEHWFGKGVGTDDFIVILIENGIGAGVVANGRMVRGNLGIAGEFGHMSLNPDGPLCRCGKRGCIEAYCGMYAIMKDVSRVLTPDGNSDAGESAAFDDVVLAANQGNPILRNIFHQAGKALGLGISQLITLFNPEKIIITGTGVQAENLLFDPMFDAIAANQSGKFRASEPEILITSWTSEDFAKGAGTLVLQEIYKSPVLRA